MANSANGVQLLVLEGDGIGPEIMAATLAVLRAADAKFGLGLAFEAAQIGWRVAAHERHHACRRRRREGQGRAWRAARAGVAQRLSAARARRPQSVRRIAQAARALRQYPPGALARRLSAALRQAGRSRHRAREHRRLLRRPLDVPGLRRIHADARSCARRAQDHAARLDAHRRGRVQAGDAAAQKGHRRAQGQCAARLRRAFSRMRARGRRALPASQIRGAH